MLWLCSVGLWSDLLLCCKLAKIIQKKHLFSAFCGNLGEAEGLFFHIDLAELTKLVIQLQCCDCRLGGGSPCICLTLQILSSLACLYTTVINCLMICCCVQCRLTVYPVVKTCCGVCWSWTRARDLTSKRSTLRILCTRLSVETFWSLDSW